MTLRSAPLADVAALQVQGVFAKAPQLQTAKSCRSARLARWARQSSEGQPETLGRRLFAALVALLLGPRRSRAATGPPPPEGDEIVKVIDGDTVNLKFAGRCRLIGINTPETVAPRQKEGAPPDCYGPEASAVTKSLLPPGTKVKVELDVEPVDKYGRQLAYLYRSSDQLFLNAELVKQGAAKRYKVAPNVKYDAKFVELEKDAKAAGKGLWGACASKSPASGGSEELAQLQEEHRLLLPAEDRRARHIVTVLKPAPGATLRVGVVDVGVGRLSVEVRVGGEVELSCKELVLEPLAPSPHVELLLAMPRPKALSGALGTGGAAGMTHKEAQLGLRRIVLTNAWRVEKAYFSSHSTEPKRYIPELLEGLEQAVCTTLPEVRIEMRLKPFIEDQVDVLFPKDRYLRLFCHPGSAGLRLRDAVAAGCPGPPRAVVLAVGPEGGWVDYEAQLFREHGFVQVSLGRRIYTTDCAIISLTTLAADALAEAAAPQTPWSAWLVKDLKKKTCKDFSSYEDAKAWFDKYFPQYGDVAGLDGDKDGKPCEKLLKKRSECHDQGISHHLEVEHPEEKHQELLERLLLRWADRWKEEGIPLQRFSNLRSATNFADKVAQVVAGESGLQHQCMAETRICMEHAFGTILSKSQISGWQLRQELSVDELREECMQRSLSWRAEGGQEKLELLERLVMACCAQAGGFPRTLGGWEGAIRSDSVVSIWVSLKIWYTPNSGHWEHDD
eukprot:s3211_g10.t1